MLYGSMKHCAASLGSKGERITCHGQDAPTAGLWQCLLLPAPSECHCLGWKPKPALYLKLNLHMKCAHEDGRRAAVRICCMVLSVLVRPWTPSSLQLVPWPACLQLNLAAYFPDCCLHIAHNPCNPSLFCYAIERALGLEMLG